MSIAAGSALGKLLFVSDRAGQPDLYLINSDGFELVRLTDDGSWHFDPVWSPDGTQIAFVRQERTLENRIAASEIYVMNADGTSPMSLSSELTGIASFEPAWSTDGSRIAFSGMDINRMGEAFNTSQIYVIDLETLEIEQVTDAYEGNVGCSLPKWLPGDQQIALYCHGLMQGGVVLKDLETDKSWQVVDWPWITFEINSDGSRLVYFEPEGSFYVPVVSDIRNSDLDYTEREISTIYFDEAMWGFAWSPFEPDQYIIHTETALYQGNVEQEQLEVILDNPPAPPAMGTSYLTWSPDGASLAFVGEMEDNQDIYAVAIDKGTLIRLTDDPSADYGPLWQPDVR